MILKTQQPGPARPEAGRARPGSVNSKALLGGHRELTIVHNDQEYKLRLTGNDKLILTK